MKIIEVSYKEKKEELPEWLYRKQMTCPVCKRTFFDSYPRYTRLRVEYVEPDLRPHYVADVSPLGYDITVCFNCGYSMLTDCYEEVSETQRKALREKILPKFHVRHYPLVLTREQSEERYKLAQLSGQVMNLKASEWGYLMLHSAWFYKKTDEGEQVDPNEKVDLGEETLKYYKEAATSFAEAYIAEPFPIRGMNALTMAYLETLLFYRLGDLEESKKWLRECMNKEEFNAYENKKVKEKVLEIKEILSAETKESE